MRIGQHAVRTLWRERGAGPGGGRHAGLSAALVALKVPMQLGLGRAEALRGAAGLAAQIQTDQSPGS